MAGSPKASTERSVAGAHESSCPVHGRGAGAEPDPAAGRRAEPAGAAIPGPPPLPLIGWRGNALRHFRDPIAGMLRLQRDYGPVARLVRGGNDPLFFQPSADRTGTVFAFGAACNREILTQPEVFESDLLRAPKGCDFLVHNMSSANGPRRREQRRMMMPAFTKDHLRLYHGEMVRFTERMLGSWRPGERIELWHALESLCADIASKTFYGQDPGRANGGHQTLAGMAREIAGAMFSPITMMSIDLPGSPYRRFLELAGRAETLILDEIAKKRAAGLPGDDVLSMMIKTQEADAIELSDTELVGNAFTLFLAGHDVPANAIGFTLLLLAQHPQVAAELEAELDGALGGAAPDFDILWRLPVLDRVIKESLRVLCPAVVLWRRVTEPATLAGYEVPVGSEVLFSPYVTHLDADLYPEPRRFVPERWRDLKPNAFEYLPFSYGFRKCLGAAFAETLLRVVIAMTVPRFRLEPVAGTKVDLFVTFTMKPKRGLPVTVRSQDGAFARSRVPLRGAIVEMVDFT